MGIKSHEQMLNESIEIAISQEHIIKEIKDSIMTLTFNRSKKMNALTQAMYILIANYLN
jgi:enoyl-CoA hydratase/carnithine racemase